jgi:hypothetical protein
MAKRARLVIGDFPGWMPNLDEGALPTGGSPVQINLSCQRVGRIETRRGMKPMQSDSVTDIESLEADAS